MDNMIDIKELLAMPLPSRPGLGQTVLQLSRQNQVTPDELAERIRSDPALSGRILQLANQTGRATGRQVASLDGDTVILVGMPAVCRAARAAKPPSPCADGAGHQHFWSHALAMACAAQVLGNLVRLAPPTELFICGLLAGTGRLGLATARPQAYAQLQQRFGAAPPALVAREERRQFGIDHLGLASMLMAGWGLPEPFCEAVLHHAAPQDYDLDPGGRVQRLARLLQLSARIADQCLDDAAAGAAGAAMPGQLFDLGRECGLEAAQLATAVRHSAADWSEWDLLLGPWGGWPEPTAARRLTMCGLGF